jgi:hypothetical protein
MLNYALLMFWCITFLLHPSCGNVPQGIARSRRCYSLRNLYLSMCRLVRQSEAWQGGAQESD